MTRLGFAINLDACCDHRSCMVACKRKNDAFTGACFLETFTVTDDNLDSPNTYFIPIMCQHCAKPTCVPACSKSVIIKREDGLVVMGSTDSCTTCEGVPCVAACPYGAIDFDPVTHVVGKCDGCADLVDVGEVPACIPNCWLNTIAFGDFDDPASMVSQAIAQYGPAAHELSPETGNEPTTRYLLASKQWRDRQGLKSAAWHNSVQGREDV